MSSFSVPKTLGVIGGMGPLATQLYLKKVIESTDASCDQEHIPMIILNHCTMPDRTAAILGNYAEEVFSLLLQDARFLQQHHADFIAIPCNTSHYFVDRLQDEIDIPIIHMLRETVTSIKKRGARRVGILATDGTLQTAIYQKEMRRQGIEPVAPSPAAQQCVMDIIYRDIKKGQPGNPLTFQVIDKELKDYGCDAAILACTELSCFGEQQKLGDFYVDAMDVLVEKTIEYCGAKRRSVKHGASAVSNSAIY